jgi:plasmid stability protein
MAMKKTSLYLDDAIDRALAIRAAEQGITKAELIRTALREAAAGPARPRPRAIALVDDGKPPIARDIDAYLENTGFAE